ncbi:MAG: cytochrome P450 [Pseudomonadota bacterium]
MKKLSQSPTDPQFVQDPYPFYDGARTAGDVFWWDNYAMPCAVSHRMVQAVLRDRRMGRECPPELAPDIPAHLRPFYAVEAHSMLELEQPRHKRLRGLVLRAFTSRTVAALAPEIERQCLACIDSFPDAPFDLLEAYAQPVPVNVIAKLLGVPTDYADDLLAWSNAMVAMYQARRTPEIEAAAVTATEEFVAFLKGYIAKRRKSPADDLISTLIAAEADGERLSEDELISTCILLLNAGHEATVHTLGNGVKTLLTGDHRQIDDETVEEIIRFDPPLHMFTRWVYEDVTLFDHDFHRGDQIACLLGAANRDPEVFANPNHFDPTRPTIQNSAFGGGIHFCVGAPLARLELRIALQLLFDRCPNLRIVEPPRYGDVYHFHGLRRLMVQV